MATAIYCNGAAGLRLAGAGAGAVLLMLMLMLISARL
jgi:galactokinase/mevalonate kinase-like predicted kinase